MWVMETTKLYETLEKQGFTYLHILSSEHLICQLSLSSSLSTEAGGRRAPASFYLEVSTRPLKRGGKVNVNFWVLNQSYS